MINARTIWAGAAALAIFAVPAAARAGTCEESFIKKGNPISGSRFIAMISVNDMPADVAINQMRGIVARKGYDIIASEPAAGALLIEQSHSANARAFPIEINATVANGVGTVQMEAKLRAGMFVKAEDAKTEMCSILAQLRGGKEGRLAARGGSTATTIQAAPIVMSAQELSQQISKDAERNAAAIAQRYSGKKYTLSGTVDFVVGEGKNTAITFKILQPEQMAIRLPNMASRLSLVSCQMAPGTSVFTLQLKPGKSIKLTGTFAKFLEFEHSIWLKDCVPVK